MEGISRQLLEGENWTGDVVGPFFGFMGAASALVFACKTFDALHHAALSYCKGWALRSLFSFVVSSCVFALPRLAALYMIKIFCEVGTLVGKGRLSSCLLCDLTAWTGCYLLLTCTSVEGTDWELAILWVRYDVGAC